MTSSFARPEVRGRRSTQGGGHNCDRLRRQAWLLRELPPPCQSFHVKFGLSSSGVPSAIVISRHGRNSIAAQSLSSTFTLVPLSVTKTSIGRPTMPATLVFVSG